MSDIFVGIDGTTPDPDCNVYFEQFDKPYSFIGMLYKFSPAKKKRWLAGPDLWGKGVVEDVERALAFIKEGLAEHARSGPNKQPKIFICGYSRGAYGALRVAQALGLKNIKVTCLGLIDTVKCTDDDVENRVANVIADFAGLPDPTRKKLTQAELSQMIRNQDASLIQDRMNQQARRNAALNNQVNRSPLPNALSAGFGSFAIPPNVEAGFHARRDSHVGSRTYPMGHYPLSDAEKIKERRDFACTHSAMGGMPFRGDIPSKAVTRTGEWQWSRAVANFIIANAQPTGMISGKPTHPVLARERPPASWLGADKIREQYQIYLEWFGPDGLNLPQDREIEARQLRLMQLRSESSMPAPPAGVRRF